MDFQLEDDDLHVKPDGKSFFTTEDEVRSGHNILEHGTDNDVASLSFNVIRRLCQETQSIRFSRKRKNQLIDALLKYVSTVYLYINSCFTVSCHIISVQLLGGLQILFNIQQIMAQSSCPLKRTVLLAHYQQSLDVANWRPVQSFTMEELTTHRPKDRQR
jgi:hypothetical protein